MNYKHLFWIIPITLIIGMILGEEIYVYHDGDTAPRNIHVNSRWDCEEGCIYAEWVVYGYKNLTKPKFFIDCASVCVNGEEFFKQK